MKPTSDSNSDRTLKWWASDAVVYFVAAAQPPIAVKIGVTKWDSVARRLSHLQSSNHERLELLGVIPFRGSEQPMREAEDRERELHQTFRQHQRFPEGTRGYEWFTANPSLIRYIEEHTTEPEALGFPRFIQVAG